MPAKNQKQEIELKGKSQLPGEEFQKSVESLIKKIDGSLTSKVKNKNGSK